MEFIREVLVTLGAHSWGELVGMRCRAEASLSKVHRIGHIEKDIWFDPEELSRKVDPYDGR